MTVEPAKAAASVEHGGKKYYFCSQHCAQFFRADPSKYVSGSGTTARDPVCGMTVDPVKAAGSADHAGKKYFFCSKHCLAKFQADPARYTDKARPPAPSKAAPAAKYTCPMHPEVVQLGPGSCPKCGMALVPALPPAPAAAEYTC